MLDRILVVNERHLRRILTIYLHHFNTCGHTEPSANSHRLKPIPGPDQRSDLADYQVRRRAILDGLTSEYQIAA